MKNYINIPKKSGEKKFAVKNRNPKPQEKYRILVNFCNAAAVNVHQCSGRIQAPPELNEQ